MKKIINKKESKKVMLAASMICDDFTDLKRTLKLFAKGKIDYIHFDVMDGVFVPRFGLFPELLSTVKSLTNIPADIHLMVQNPEPYIKIFAESGADIISIHPEMNPHLSRSIRLIKEAGVKAGVVLNPATPLNVLDYVLDDLDLILIMAINPGIVGHKLIPKTYEKLRDLGSKLVGRDNIIVEVDGGVTFESASKMIAAGANMLVCGTSSIFKQKKPLDIMSLNLRKTILKTVG
jgi:ribulose-phosphate 3-epimerase